MNIKPGLPILPDCKFLENQVKFGIKTLDSMAEAHYAATFVGRRTNEVHLIKRLIENSATGGRVISPAMWPFIVNYPRDVAIFYTVNPDAGTIEMDGWAYFSDIRKAAKRLGIGWQVSNEVVQQGTPPSLLLK